MEVHASFTVVCAHAFVVQLAALPKQEVSLLKVSVVVPVYDEERTIREIIQRVQAVPVDKEIIVVDDCSTDRTPEELQKLADEGAIRLFKHKVKRGKGAAGP